MFEYFDLDIWVRLGFVQGYRIKEKKKTKI